MKTSQHQLISHGRAEIVAGRASRTGIFDLFGYDLKDYDELFEEKLGLLLEFLNKFQHIGLENIVQNLEI